MPDCNISLKIADEICDAESTQSVCGDCGAAVITNRSNVMNFCVFCGSEKVIASGLVDFVKPDFIIPFKYGRDEAIAAFSKWCRAEGITPKNAVRDTTVKMLTKLYVPVWLFDCDIDMDFTANADIVSYIVTGERKSNFTTKTSSSYQLVRKRKLRFVNLIISGVTLIDDRLMEDIQPYEYSAKEDYSMKCLDDCFIVKCAQSPDIPERKLNDRLKEYCEFIFNSSVKRFTSVTDIADQSVYHKTAAHYVLLPLWILNYKHHSRTHTFVMNGNTGKTAGNTPRSAPATIRSFIFRRRRDNPANDRIACINPALSEIIKEKDLLIHREKAVTDTTERSDFLDGENRFRGNGGFGRFYGGMQFMGGFSVGEDGHDKVDSDGNRQ